MPPLFFASAVVKSGSASQQTLLALRFEECVLTNLTVCFFLEFTAGSFASVVDCCACL